jgi:hypothetical protein
MHAAPLIVRSARFGYVAIWEESTMSEDPGIYCAPNRVTDTHWSASYEPPHQPWWKHTLSIATGDAELSFLISTRQARALRWLLRKMLEAAGEPTELQSNERGYSSSRAAMKPNEFRAQFVDDTDTSESVQIIGTTPNGTGPAGMFHNPAANESADQFDQQRQRLAVTLRQIADCIEAMPDQQGADAVRLSEPAEELFKAAQVVFRRPFGE